MRLISFLAGIVLLMNSCSAPQEISTSASGSQSYVAPGYVKKKYNKIMVVAILQDNAYRKRAENALVNELKSRGFKVIPSIDIFPNEMLKDTVAMKSAAEAAGIDAAITVRFVGAVTNVADESHAVGSTWGFYGFTYGVFTTESTTATTGLVQLDFFVKDKIGTQYRTGLPFKKSNAVDDALTEFSIQARRRLVTDKIL